MLRILDRVVEAVGVAALAASTATIAANVFHRYVVLDWLRAGAKDAPWLAPVYAALDGAFAPFGATAGEVPGLLLVWVAFLGAYLALRDDRHVAFEALVRALPARVSRAIAVLADLAMLAFLAVLLVQSVRMIRIDGATAIETAAIPQGWFMLVLPVFAAAAGLAVAARLGRRRDR